MSGFLNTVLLVTSVCMYQRKFMWIKFIMTLSCNLKCRFWSSFNIIILKLLNCDLLDPNGLISLIMPSLKIQANNYVSPVIESQFFTINRVFSDTFAIIIPMYHRSVVNGFIYTRVSNIYLWHINNQTVNCVYYKESKQAGFAKILITKHLCCVVLSGHTCR